MKISCFRGILMNKISELYKNNVSEISISSESYILYRDEIDESMLPANFDIKILPEKVGVHIYLYDDIVGYILTNSDLTALYLIGISDTNKCKWSSN